MTTRIRVYSRAFIISVLISSISIIQAQGLLIDEHISDFEIKHVLNFPSDKARLTDFTGNKALLIDFWFAACASCIESFPKLDSIQKEFKDDLNIILVTFESKEKVLKTFNTIKRISHVKLPSIVEDTLLHLVFPHTSAPHEIWVSKDGKIKAITDHTSINRENIRSLIAGEKLNLPLKKDNMEYSLFDPLVKNIDLNKMYKYNVISSYQAGLPSSAGMYVHPENGFLRAKSINGYFQDMYIMAYNQWSNNFNYSRLVIDKSAFDRLKEKEDNQNAFCYDNWWRDTSRARACSEMQIELDRFFNLTSYSEKRKVPCIVLRQTGTKKRFMSATLDGKEDIYYKEDTLFIENIYLKYPTRTIFNYGRYAWAPYQFIDETGYQGQMSITLPKHFENVAQVNLFLKDYDLEVNMEERWLDVVIIKDNERLKTAGHGL